LHYHNISSFRKHLNPEELPNSQVATLDL